MIPPLRPSPRPLRKIAPGWVAQPWVCGCGRKDQGLPSAPPPGWGQDASQQGSPWVCMACLALAVMRCPTRCLCATCTAKRMARIVGAAEGQRRRSG